MKKIKNAYLIVFIFLLLAFVFSVAVGAVYISPGTIGKIIAAKFGVISQVNWPESFEAIIYQVRLPHVVLVMMTGAALAGSGAAFQGLFRNPLADPYLIGVASGAGLGAVIAMSLNWPQDLGGFSLIPLAAFLGAMVTVGLVYWLARVSTIVPLTTLILSGVAVGSFASAMTSFLMLRSNDQVYRALSFLLGGTTVSGWDPVIGSLPYLLLGLVSLGFSGHPLNVLQFGEDQARQMGLPVERVKISLIVVASLTTASAVAFSGVIGFLGLIIPHLIRMLFGPDYRHLIPLSIIAGAGGLLVADLLARVVIAPQILPVGVITSLAGAPFFLWVLRRAKREVFW
ncbi:MAG: iron ABC transporter permease [Chloroflexota bacterium]